MAEQETNIQYAEHDLNVSTGLRLAALRNLQGLTQAEFGEKFDKRQTLIQKYEDGTILPPPLFILLVCARYDVNWDYIYGGDDSRLEPALAGRLAGSLASIIAKTANRAKRKGQD